MITYIVWRLFQNKDSGSRERDLSFSRFTLHSCFILALAFICNHLVQRPALVQFGQPVVWPVEFQACFQREIHNVP